jgi:hypothetical protein
MDYRVYRVVLGPLVWLFIRRRAMTSYSAHERRNYILSRERVRNMRNISPVVPSEDVPAVATTCSREHREKALKCLTTCLRPRTMVQLLKNSQ